MTNIAKNSINLVEGIIMEENNEEVKQEEVKSEETSKTKESKMKQRDI